MKLSGVAKQAPVRAGEPGPSSPSIAWELWGDRVAGVPLLLVNGLGSPMVAYEVGFLELLIDAGFCVVRFDNRDVGLSSRVEAMAGRAAYTTVDMAADSIAVMDAVGWEAAHVFGQSMGGMICQQIAIDYPTRVLSLTSLMSSTGEPGYGRPSAEAMKALLSVAPSDREGWLANRVETEQYWASPDLWDPEWVRAKGELMFGYGVDPQGSARQFRAIQASGSRDEALSTVDVATLVIHGSADNLVGIDAGRHTADVIAGAEFVEIEGMGHDLPPQLWPLLVDTLTRFLDSGRH